MYPQKASRRIFTVQFFINILGQRSIGNGPNYTEERVWDFIHYYHEFSQSTRTEYSIFHRTPKQLDKFLFANYEVNAVVLAVFVLAKSERFPSGAVRLEEISFDATLVVLVQLATANSSLLDGVHFGHGFLLSSTRI
jgi:hypothetical protein